MIKSIEQLIDVGHYIRVALNLAHINDDDVLLILAVVANYQR